jgi:hypothetical protein
MQKSVLIKHLKRLNFLVFYLMPGTWKRVRKAEYFLRGWQPTQLVNKVAAFYESQWFIIAFTKVPFWNKSSHPVFLKSILKLFFHTLIGSWSSSIPSGFQTKFVCSFLSSRMHAK